MLGCPGDFKAATGIQLAKRRGFSVPAGPHGKGPSSDPNSRALVLRTPIKRDPQFIEAAM